MALGAAVSKLGELFIQFGMKGGGELMKGLRGISADFLLMKNAGQQALNPLIQMSKVSASSVIEFDKLNAVTGLGANNLRNLYLWATKNNVEWGSFSGQIQKIQDMIAGVQSGLGKVSPGWRTLGIQPYELDYKDPMEVIRLLAKRVNELDPIQAKLGFSQLGLDPNLLYALKQLNKEYDKRAELSNEEWKNLRKQNEAWKDLEIAFESFKTKFIGGQTWINKLTENFTGLLYTASDILNKDLDKPLLQKVVEEESKNISGHKYNITKLQTTFATNPMGAILMPQFDKILQGIMSIASKPTTVIIHQDNRGANGEEIGRETKRALETRNISAKNLSAN